MYSARRGLCAVGSILHIVSSVRRGPPPPRHPRWQQTGRKRDNPRCVFLPGATSLVSRRAGLGFRLGVTETTVSTPELLCPIDLPHPPPLSSLPQGLLSACWSDKVVWWVYGVRVILPPPRRPRCLANGANEPPELKKQPRVTSHNSVDRRSGVKISRKTHPSTEPIFCWLGNIHENKER